MKDIEGIEDIKWMVDTFYGKVREDDLLGPIFLSRLGEDWTHHLDNMYSFWNMAIFSVRDYTGQPFPKHIHLPVDSMHFDRWLLHFNATLDERFNGPVTEQTKKKAQQIAATFLYKITALRS
jgi:hemoglobin